MNQFETAENAKLLNASFCFQWLVVPHSPEFFVFQGSMKTLDAVDCPPSTKHGSLLHRITRVPTEIVGMRKTQIRRLFSLTFPQHESPTTRALVCSCTGKYGKVETNVKPFAGVLIPNLDKPALWFLSLLFATLHSLASDGKESFLTFLIEAHGVQPLAALFDSPDESPA